jgi:hypothetical protein
MANPKGNPQNLKLIKKGEVRNPTGRPRKIPALDTLLADLFGDDGSGKSGAMDVLNTLRLAATQGKMSATRVRAAEILADRIYGKAKSNDTLKIKVETPEQIAEGNAKAKALLEHYNLAKRGKSNA